MKKLLTRLYTIWLERKESRVSPAWLKWQKQRARNQEGLERRVLRPDSRDERTSSYTRGVS